MKLHLEVDEHPKILVPYHPKVGDDDWEWFILIPPIKNVDEYLGMVQMALYKTHIKKSIFWK